MQDIVNIFTNTSTTIVILAYFIWRDIKFMNKLEDTLAVIVETLKDGKE